MKQNLKYKRCKINSKAEYWFDIIVGGILTFGIIFLVGNLNLMKFKLEYLNVYYFTICLLIVVYFQWKDDNIEIIKTELSIKENFELVEKVLQKLDWKYKAKSKGIELEYNKYLLKFLDITIIPDSKIIYFNFKYQATVRTGRVPFFFGISWFLKWKFKDSLLSELKNKNRNANSS